MIFADEERHLSDVLSSLRALTDKFEDQQRLRLSVAIDMLERCTEPNKSRVVIRGYLGVAVSHINYLIKELEKELEKTKAEADEAKIIQDVAK